MSWGIAIGLAVLVAVVILGLMRINELFVLRKTAGKLIVVRGRIPPRLLGDIDDVLRHAKVDGVVLRGVSEQGRLRLRAKGAELGAAVQQRLRNVAAQWPLAKVRNAPRRR
jgi:hypothetical protein